ncbi:MAG: hypothetical protein WC455_25200 [Dehalococcoidia bacterium]|jgi:hypothetical protein
MDQTICPIRAVGIGSTQSGNDQPCIRERCAWWCSPKQCTVDCGDCAITILAVRALESSKN